jgi:hypothetical protein
MKQQREFSLRLSIYPYIMYLVVCSGLTLLSAFTAIRTHDWSPLLIAAAAWLIVILTQYGNTRYRIYWRDGEIKQISVNNYITIIPTAEITCIGQERSDLQTRLQMRRPADRITIYADHGDEERRIDVSLRHFVASDIRRLLRAIHDKRPDLTVPKKWL